MIAEAFDMETGQRREMIVAIYAQAQVLERICLEPG